MPLPTMEDTTLQFPSMQKLWEFQKHAKLLNFEFFSDYCQGAFTVLKNFDLYTGNSYSGNSSLGTLIKGRDGAFYGMAKDGGALK